MAKRGPKPNQNKGGRPAGATTHCDDWIQQHAEYLCYSAGIPLKTAIQYAVGDLKRYIVSERNARERYSEKDYKVHMRLLDAMEAIIDAEIVYAKRADKRKEGYAKAGWECLNSGSIPSYHLGPPDVSSDNPIVKRNYERMAGKSR